MMKRMLASLLIACVPAHAQVKVAPDCGGATPEVNACIADALGQADDALNKIYRLLLKELASGTYDSHLVFAERRASLITAEKAWVAFRDSQCDAERARWGFGTGMGAAGLNCQLDLTNERVKYLEKYESEVRDDANLCHKDKAGCAVVQGK